MAVSITWSSTNGGAAVTEPLDHGVDSNGTILGTQELFLRHDGTNQITDCGFFLAEKSGTYGGDQSAALDLAEILGWGDGADADAFGGFQINMDATGGYSGNWPAFGDKAGSTYNVFRTGVGDSEANKILLATEMGLSGAAGTIQAGASPNVRFQCRIAIPEDEDTPGVRQFDQRLRYTYTS